MAAGLGLLGRAKLSQGLNPAAPRPEAFLVDVYETILTCDFEVLRNELPVIAGVEPEAWNEGFARLGPDLTHGRAHDGRGVRADLQHLWH